MNDIKMNKLIQDLKFVKNLNSNFQKLKCDGERHTSFKNFRWCYLLMVFYAGLG